MENIEEKFVSQQELDQQRKILLKINKIWTDQFINKNGRKPKYAIQTYGCQMNERDSEHLHGLLQIAGFENDEYDVADLIIFNTCCVREHAEFRVFGNVGALNKRKKRNPDLIIAVCGCMMQQENIAKELYKRFPFVDMIFGTHSLYSFANLLSNVLQKKQRVFDVRQSEGRIAENLPAVRAKKSSAFVTVMYGCNNFCSYCIVPYVRGRERSRQMGDILSDLQKLVEDGVKEVTLLGQNVNSYGKDLLVEQQPFTFAELLRNANKMEGLKRIRFMTSHPKDLSDELIKTMQECDKVCKHIHLPIQSGSDKILKEMNRGYDRTHYIDLVNKLRKAMPDIEITTDIIVGFPGENQQDFEQTLDLVKHVAFSSAFTFMYSPREGTPASAMPNQIDQQEKKDRLHCLNAIQSEITIQNNQRFIGRTFSILVDGFDKKNGMVYGRTDNFKTVYFEGESLKEGEDVEVLINGGRKSTLSGELL